MEADHSLNRKQYKSKSKAITTLERMDKSILPFSSVLLVGSYLQQHVHQRADKELNVRYGPTHDLEKIPRK